MPHRGRHDRVAERERLVAQLDQLEIALAPAGGVASVARWLWRHPAWPLGLGLLLVLRRPRRLATWAARVFWAWGVLRQLRRWWAAVG